MSRWTSSEPLTKATGSSTFAPVTVDPLRFDSTRLRALKAALGNRAAAPVDIMCFGDSVTEGTAASTIGKRWVNLLLTQLRARYQPSGVVGGEGYVPGHYVAAGFTDRFSVLSGGGLARIDLGGLGARTWLVSSSGVSRITFTGTGCDILYLQGTTGGLMGWSIDGGAQTTVQTNQLTLVGGQVAQIRGLSAASHTLDIQQVSGGTAVYVEGVMVYNGDEATGIRLWEGGHSAYQSDDFLVAGNSMLHFDATAAIQPDLITIMLGLNDYASGSQTRLTAATVKANLKTIIANHRAKCTLPPSILLMIPWERSTTGTLLDTWAAYRTAITQVASEDGAIALLDLGNVIGSFVAGDPYNLDNADGLHPNDAGHQMIADAAFSLITAG